MNNSVPRSARRARRFASEEAHAWARDLRLRDPITKAILVAMTLYVNGDGVCFVSLEQLAEDVEVSVDTVRRRLPWLAKIGAITRRAQWVDANGRRNGEHRGRRTTDEIRLRLETTSEEIKANIDLVDQGGTIDVIKYDDQYGDADAADCSQHEAREYEAGNGLEVGQPSHCSQGLILKPEPKPEDSPSSPPSQADSELRAFIIAWGEPIDNMSEVKKIWRALRTADRVGAPIAVAAYRAFLKAAGKKGRIRSAQAFLRQRESWPTFVEFIKKLGDPAVAAFEPVGSAAWRARCTIAKIIGSTLPVAVDVPEGRGNRFTPLAPEYIGLEKYADDDPGTWQFIEAADPRCRAWCDFLKIEPRPIVLRTKTKELHGRVFPDWPDKRTGLRLPTDWPPGRGAEVRP
jgi:hypothetical protein